MSSNNAITKQNLPTSSKSEELGEFLTMKIGDQNFGISVISIRDVLVVKEITPVPLSPQEIIGLINLRGRVVTALDIRAILKMPDRFDLEHSMSVVVDYKGDLYSLMVDSIGEVISFPVSKIIPTPENLPKSWKDVSMGIYPVENNLIVIVNIDKLLQGIDISTELSTEGEQK